MTHNQAMGISSWMTAIYLLLAASMVYPEGNWTIIVALSAVNSLIGLYRLSRKDAE